MGDLETIRKGKGVITQMITNITEREDKLCTLLGWLACHVDEDVEHKSKHVKQSLNDAVDYLESIGWYDFNALRRKVKE